MRALFWITLVLLQFWAVAVAGSTISSAAASGTTLLTTTLILGLALWGVEHWRSQCSTALDLVEQLETKLANTEEENALLELQIAQIRTDFSNVVIANRANASRATARVQATQDAETVTFMSTNMTKPAARECLETIDEFQQVLVEQLRGDRPRRRQRYSVRDIYRILPAAVMIFARRYQARAAKYGYSTTLEDEEAPAMPPEEEPVHEPPLRPLEFDD